MNRKTQKKKKLAERGVGVRALGRREFAGGPCRLYSKRLKGEKGSGEEQRRDGNLVGRAYSRRGVRATSKGSIFKCTYADILLDISSEPGYTRAMMAVKVYFYFFSRHP